MENMRGSRGRGRRGRGRSRPTRGGARRKKSVDHKDDSPLEEEEQDLNAPILLSHPTPVHIAPPLDMEADISQLEAPTFTTLSRGPPEPMTRLQWNHPVNLLGEKVLNPMIHCCDTCLRPVLIYGRMIPCKHVFCLSCAQRDSKICPRCNDKVVRVEQTGLGTVFMCTHGGTRYGNTGCRRTYLSQRDLQAHVNHRHVVGPPQVGVINQMPLQCNKVPVPAKQEPRLSGGAVTSPFYEPGKVKLFEDQDSLSYVSPRAPEAVAGVPPSTVRPPPRPCNLITVPIQEPPPESFYPAFSQPPPTHTAPPPLAPPPLAGPIAPPQPYYPPYDFPPPHTDTSVPPPNQWVGNPPFYG